jgi:iron complex transport system permease protein
VNRGCFFVAFFYFRRMAMAFDCHGKIYEPAVSGITQAYLNHMRGRMAVLAILTGAVLVLGLYAVTNGSYEISAEKLIGVLTGKVKGPCSIVIREIRLPRVVASLVCGWGLAVSGLAIQSLLKNPLGSPSTLGISHGAAFGAALSIIGFGGKAVFTTMAAFTGAMTATFVILLLSALKKFSPETIILAGVALSALFSSATILMQYLASETQLAMVVFWTFGDVARSGWKEICLLTAGVVAVSLFLAVFRWDLNAMASGDESARGLGVNVGRIRLSGMVAAAFIAAMATAFHGIIAFVGLIAPHVARQVAGDDHCLLIPFSAVLGALLLLGADTFGRIFMGSGALPVGVITSFAGAPVFLYLLVRGYR